MNVKRYFSSLSIQDYIFIVFSILWVGIIMLDYLNKQVVYIPSITHFKYIKLFTFLGALGAFLSLYYNKYLIFKDWRPIKVTGLFIFALMLLIICCITLAYNQYWNAPLDYTNYLHLIGKGVYTLGCTYLIILSAYSAGQFFRAKLLKNVPFDLTFGLLDLSIGFVIVTFVLMLLGALAVLTQITVLGVITLLILPNYRVAWTFMKATLFKPIPRPSDLNFWGGILAFFIIVYITMNYMYTQAPYPLGFDARNYYVNIPKLISDSGALVPGFQPYAWGLIMSTGYIAFNSPEITMFLSVTGGLLSLFAIYHFCHRYIHLSSNFSFAVVLLYLLTPTVTNHFIIEFKIDLTLVFFQMVIINFIMWWFFHNKSEERTSLLSNESDTKALVIIGLLLGYCLSIKVLSVFLIVGIFIGFWWYSKDITGVLGLAALTIGFILVAQLDNLSGLRDYHLSPTTTGIVLIIIGMVLMVMSFIKSRGQFIITTKALLICGLTCLLTFSPWVYKNYSYKKSTSLIHLLMGEKPRPGIKFKRIAE